MWQSRKYYRQYIYIYAIMCYMRVGPLTLSQILSIMFLSIMSKSLKISQIMNNLQNHKRNIKNRAQISKFHNTFLKKLIRNIVRQWGHIWYFLCWTCQKKRYEWNMSFTFEDIAILRKCFINTSHKIVTYWFTFPSFETYINRDIPTKKQRNIWFLEVFLDSIGVGYA